MDIFLVGGAVRDNLMGLSATDYDWVVVGADQKALLKQGYLRVGKGFPVFLHPKTKEEYALARTERKTGPQHTDFDCDARSSITLEQDLYRRDLTINAIAQDKDGKLVDPYGGQEDLKARILRHVSPAFAEDPLRVLRVARFAARFPEFEIDASTMKLMREMIDAKFLHGLTPERVFEETKKALSTRKPHRYFETLKDINADLQLWPELKENDIKRLKKWSSNTNPVHSFTILSGLLGINAVSRLTERLRFPAAYKQVSVLTMKIREIDLANTPPAEIVNTLYELNAFRLPKRFKEASTLASTLNKLERTGLPDNNEWPKYLSAAAAITAAAVDLTVSGAQIGREIRKAQIVRIDQLKGSTK